MPKSAEAIYRVQPASKSTSAAPVDIGFEIYGPDSFQSNDRSPASGEIANGINQLLSRPFSGFHLFQVISSTMARALSRDGLIKFQSISSNGTIETVLQEFYVRSICTGRTLLKDNIYLNQVLPFTTNFKAPLWAVYVISASYYKEFLDEGSEQKEMMKQSEICYLRKAVEALSQVSAAIQAATAVQDATNMLLIHHAILNPDLHERPWTEQLYESDYRDYSQANIVIAGHAIWLMAFLPLTDDYSFQTYNYSWVGTGDWKDINKVHGIVGCSPGLLLIQYFIRFAAKCHAIPSDVIDRIQKLSPWVDDSENDRVKEIALETCGVYIDATLLYAYVRLYRKLPCEPVVKEISSRLVRKLCHLPSSGKYYSGLHPAWCFLTACACTEELEEYSSMLAILNNIGSENKSVGFSFV
ncbi:hypothetical protein K491DRAFT_48930 [Lophiostoma macrostomum CBS 122681]|uniref:Uncharacterized protein n=1 Tax=Lophiostoma macrostomum CBS 122681 TaxID=1314788 RepID=A0A6A6SXW6_9PLEO|nr:hypothetical protein K491DRAFT_48930 [Lophiostoma macrostomum CBS 122681]